LVVVTGVVGVVGLVIVVVGLTAVEVISKQDPGFPQYASKDLSLVVPLLSHVKSATSVEFKSVHRASL
jgi:hypothetical protein